MPIVKHQGFITHFASSEEADNPETAAQIDRFFKTVKRAGRKSLANSAAILGMPASMQIGCVLAFYFGVSPYPVGWAR